MDGQPDFDGSFRLSKELREQLAAARLAIGENQLASARAAVAAISGGIGASLSAKAAELNRLALLGSEFAGQHLSASLQRQIREALAVVTGVYTEDVLKSFAALGQLYADDVRARFAELAQDFHRLWDESRPPNWPDDVDEIGTVIDLMRETGYCLVWAPRREIIDELLAAEPSDRNAVLLTRRDEILADLVALLHDIDEPTLQAAREATEEAIAAFRDGYHRAAQALASVIFTELIHSKFNPRLAEARKAFEEQEPEECGIQELRLRSIFVTARAALESWYPDDPRPAPKAFNRHVSSHRLTPEQYTEHNALAGLMLVAPFLRELDSLTKLIAARKQQRDANAA